MSEHYDSMRRNLVRHWENKAHEADERARSIWLEDPSDEESIDAAKREAEEARTRLSEVRRDTLTPKRIITP